MLSVMGLLAVPIISLTASPAAAAVTFAPYANVGVNGSVGIDCDNVNNRLVVSGPDYFTDQVKMFTITNIFNGTGQVQPFAPAFTGVEEVKVEVAPVNVGGG